MAGSREIKGFEVQSVTEVPDSMEHDVRKIVFDAFTADKNNSLRIYNSQGQSPTIEITQNRNPDVPTNYAPPGQTNFILVRWNTPISVTEDRLESHFEWSRYGRGSVQSVKLYLERNAALVEFTDESCVINVLLSAPIMYDGTELHVTPFKPQLPYGTPLNVNIQRSLSEDWAESILEKQLDCIAPVTNSDKLIAMMRRGVRVVRGRDWIYGNQDAGGIGTVTQVTLGPYPSTLWVSVQWDHGFDWNYRMGGGFFDLKLAPTVQ